jgi:hypothetical protein
VGVRGSVLDDEVSLAFDREWSDLADVGSIVQGGEGFVELEGLVY